MSMKIAARGLQKVFDRETVLEGLDFSVEKGECVSLIGPSGAGKTTLLKLIAGIEQPDQGEIRIDPPPSRLVPVILVFQDYVLFPHQSVFSNISFGLRARRLPKKEVTRLVEEYLDYVGLSDKASAYPNQLSAGQRQRVAIARAMVVNPGILLLDEPFANLDRNLKMETAQFIRETGRRFGTTIVSVTHDLEEAFAMSDKVGILLDGKLEQYGSSREVYFNPATYAAAQFLGPVNIISRGLYPQLEWPMDQPEGERVFARGEGLDIIPDPRGPWEIEDIRFIGILILYTILCGNQRYRVYSIGEGLNIGDRVRCRVSRYFEDADAEVGAALKV